jgi:hypothetical protein
MLIGGCSVLQLVATEFLHNRITRKLNDLRVRMSDYFRARKSGREKSRKCQGRLRLISGARTRADVAIAAKNASVTKIAHDAHLRSRRTNCTC